MRIGGIDVTQISPADCKIEGGLETIINIYHADVIAKVPRHTALVELR
jgi:hypothetical protein